MPSSPGYLVGEDRDTVRKRASFFCVNDITGETYWSGKSFPEPWWIGIEAVSSTMVFLHEYATPDMPEHKKIHAVNLSTGVLAWSNQELKFLFVQGNHVYAVQDNFDKRIYFALDMTTGNIVSEVDREYLTTVQEEVRGDRFSRIEYPRLCTDESIGSEVYQKVQFVLSRVQNPVHPEYLVTNNCLIVSYYENLSGTGDGSEFRQNLLVASLDGKKNLYLDSILSRANAPMSGSFFCIDDFFYYVREKNTLTAVNISPVGGSHGKN